MVKWKHEACGAEAPTRQRPCSECGRFDGEWSRVDAPPPSIDAAPAFDSAAPSVCPRCSRANMAGERACVTCGFVTCGPSLRAVLPDGLEVELGSSETLVFGRDEAHSRFAASFVDFTNTSRRHASLHVAADGTLVVTDHDSTNGTWIESDGEVRPIPPGVPTQLAVPCRLQFGNDAQHSNASLRIVR